MQESFLHFIWKYQQFDSSGLQTTTGLPMAIFGTGHHNSNEGPDFLNSRLKIDDIQWHGHVEIHVSSSDWERHQHQLNPKYNNVVLHVVWNHDRECVRQDGEQLPVLELKGRVNLDLISKYETLMESADQIVCSAQFSRIPSIITTSALDAACVERLNAKSQLILDLLDENNGGWEETAYQVLVKNFGFKRNAETFLKLASSLPFKILKKHTIDGFQIESLLFGMAGLISNHEDQYASKLLKEYEFLAKKYGLKNKELIRVEWDFHRMRPGNFPTIRLSQLSSFIIGNHSLFDTLVNYSSVSELKRKFSLNVSPYWQTHHDFGKESSRKHAGMGQSSIDNLLINTVAPLLFAYGRSINEPKYFERAEELLLSIKAERNSILNQWVGLGVQPENAFYSQAILQLNNEYCLKKRCLSCKIGVKLLQDSN